MRARKKELGDTQKQKRKQKPKMQPQPGEVHGKVNKYERKEQRLAKQRKCMAILRNDHTHRSLNSFNEHLAIFVDSSIFWLTLLLQFKGYWDMYMRMLNGHAQGIHCKYIHLVQLMSPLEAI